MEQYKLAVEMADRVSSRRGNANAFHLAIQSALIGLLGVEGARQWAVAAAGILLSLTWFLQLRSYRQLNAAKYDVINSLEEALPAAVFTREWSLLSRQPPAPWRERYTELGYVERLVPAAFAAIFLAFLIESV